jgi:osmoprotectant transport system permease protein
MSGTNQGHGQDRERGTTRRGGARRFALSIALSIGALLPSARASTAAVATPAPTADSAPAADAGTVLRIGSKRFTESYLLAHLMAEAARPAGPVEVKEGLGNTAITWEALRAGAIDAYPEYTGTLDLEILKNAAPTSIEAMRAQLAPMGIGVALPFGFNDGYGLAMREDVAARNGVRTLSDLARHPALRLGLTHEFLGRADGWPSLVAHYRLPQRPAGLDHGLAYDALSLGQVDAIDIYTTDARIAPLGLRVLEDDAHAFPRYDAVIVYRLDVPARHPAAWAALQRLQGRVDERSMIAMNAQAEIDHAPFAAIAKARWAAIGGASRAGAASATGGPAGAASAAGGPPALAGATFSDRLFGPDLARLTAQHLTLVALAVALAVLVGVPLAVAVSDHARTRGAVLAATGLLQTVPSLALLAALVSALGRIGTAPALAALALYALLPVMRNTCTGLAQVPEGLRQSAMALGFTRGQRLRLVELPLARPVILAGIRTATTISVGTATLAAFIGAGGYGERIVAGLALNDSGLMLAGAVPSAALALVAEAIFAALERLWRVPGAARAAPDGPAVQG